jgi:hypothetical protein
MGEGPLVYVAVSLIKERRKTGQLFVMSSDRMCELRAEIHEHPAWNI